MTDKLNYETANLNAAPNNIKIKNEFNKYKQATLGDLHGNFLKLLNFLIRENIIEVNKKTYDSLVTIYNKSQFSYSKNSQRVKLNITLNEIEEFKETLNSIKINKNTNFFRLIGDEVADRGQNDYYTLKLIKKLTDHNVPFEIIYSNHGNFLLEFLKEYKKEPCIEKIFNPELDYANSFIPFLALEAHEFINTRERRILSKAWLNKIKLISYSISLTEDRITIFTHAPVDLNIIELAANQLRVQYADKSPISLAYSINQINEAFQKNFLLKFEPISIRNENDALYKIIWNRDVTQLERQEEYKNYKVTFVHGHDPTPTRQTNAFNLDHNNLLGKHKIFSEGQLVKLNTIGLTYEDLFLASSNINIELAKTRQKLLRNEYESLRTKYVESLRTKHELNQATDKASQTDDDYHKSENEKLNKQKDNIKILKAYNENAVKIKKLIDDYKCTLEPMKHKFTTKTYARNQLTAVKNLDSGLNEAIIEANQLLEKNGEIDSVELGKNLCRIKSEINNIYKKISNSKDPDIKLICKSHLGEKMILRILQICLALLSLMVIPIACSIAAKINLTKNNLFFRNTTSEIRSNKLIENIQESIPHHIRTH